MRRNKWKGEDVKKGRKNSIEVVENALVEFIQDVKIVVLLTEGFIRGAKLKY